MGKITFVNITGGQSTKSNFETRTRNKAKTDTRLDTG